MTFKNFKSTCSAAKSDTIAGVLGLDTPLQVYNLAEQMKILSSNTTLCGDESFTKEWTENVSSDWINCCGGNKMSYNFFMDWFNGGNPKQMDTTTLFQRYRSNEDQNVSSASAGLNVPGTTQRFQLAKANHSGKGTASPLFIGAQLFNYRNSQMYTITDIDKSTPNAFIIEVESNTTSNASIALDDKFIVLPAVMIGGNSCVVGETTINTHFTTKKTNQARLRLNWKMEMQVDKPYRGKLKFAPWIDKNGQVHEKAMPTLKMNAMLQVTQMANLMLFVGNTITNPALTLDDWNGGEGMLEALKGAGKQWDYSASEGFSLLNDFEEIILIEDGKKLTTEFAIMGSLRFLAGQTEKLRKDTRSEITPLDFGTIKRYGAGQTEIEKHEVLSFKYLGKKVVFKIMNELNKSNSIGNGFFPDLGIMLAMDGLENNDGENIPPMQFYRSAEAGRGVWEDMQEVDRNNMLITGCETLEGDIIKSLFWIFNCPDSHYLLNPTYCA